LCTVESPIAGEIKQKIVEQDERDTELIFRPLRNTARVAKNTVSTEVVRILADGGEFADVQELVAGARGRLVYENGDPEAGIWSVGLVQGLIHDIPTCEDLIRRIVNEAVDLIRGGLAGVVAPAEAAVA
jgi:nitronate monooxygenase